MRFSIACFCLSLPLLAQQGPIGIMRGHLLEWESGPPGQITIRAKDNRVYRFTYDDKTYFERDEQHSSPDRLRKDDNLEIVCDRIPGKPLAYARTVQVVETPPPRRRLPTTYYRPYRSPLDDILPRGNLTFSGVVSRVDDEMMVLHTREKGMQHILLRPDTRYLHDGSEVALSTLKPNTRVFIRAGTNLDNDVEAYQVVWGEILQPGR